MHLIFALLEALFPIIAADFELDDFCAIEPVLDLVALDVNAAVIPLADRLQWFVVRSRNQFVKRCRAVSRVLSILIFGVVENLVFET